MDKITTKAEEQKAFEESIREWKNTPSIFLPSRTGLENQFFYKNLEGKYLGSFNIKDVLKTQMHEDKLVIFLNDVSEQYRYIPFPQPKGGFKEELRKMDVVTEIVLEGEDVQSFIALSKIN